MKLMTVVLGLVLNFNLALAANPAYPQNPHPSLTPGALCNSRSTLRYPERIPYCDRDVSGDRKDLVVERYDANFGYQIERMGRRNFKIDHYIPLCMGGSNDETNLWPQHPSIYAITDPLEQALCDKMALGLLKQVDAVRLIKEAKNNLSRASAILESVRSI